MSYNDAFILRTCFVGNRARQYLEGLLLNQSRGNCSRFAKKVRKGTSQSLQNFIADSPWVQKQYCGRLGKIDIAALRVYTVENGLPGKEQWLILRKDIGQDSFKYQLSNAPLDADLSRFAKMSCSRYWIERAFEDAKDVGSLADYEARSWRSWHHHIVVVLLAMLAVLMIQIEYVFSRPALWLAFVGYLALFAPMLSVSS